MEASDAIVGRRVRQFRTREEKRLIVEETRRAGVSVATFRPASSRGPRGQVFVRGVKGDPSRAPQDVLRRMRPHRAGAGAQPPDRSRHGWPGPARPCPHRQVLRSSPALSPVRDLCAGRRRSRPLNPGQVGWREQCLARTSGRGAAPLCHLGRQAAWRRPGSPRTVLCPWGGDTPVPVLAPGTGKTKTGRLWTYVRDDRPSGSLDSPAVWFAYSPDRKGEHPQRHLQHYRGILQADAYAGYVASAVMLRNGNPGKSACGLGCE